MELSNFIKNAENLLGELESSVIVFQGAVYPHIFFMQLFDLCKHQLGLDIKTIDLQSGDFSWKSQLATSFLGMSCTYWLGDASLLKAKQKYDIISYLATYQGPHKIVLFIDGKTDLTQYKHFSLVMIKDRYFFDDAKTLWITQDIKEAQKSAAFLHKIYKIKNSFTLDELYLLKNYQNVIAADSDEFYESWVMRLVLPDTSLFMLSQLFFEKKEQAFLRLWLQMKLLYPDMFWISFWSDQFYRAYFFIAFTKEENYAAVKQVSYGLSFSFMKQTYKQYQIGEIQRLHEALYAIDTALKNGGNSYQIDQLYVDFFNGRFKN